MSTTRVTKIEAELWKEMRTAAREHERACAALHEVEKRIVAIVEMSCGELGQKIRVRAITDDGYAVYAQFSLKESHEDDDVEDGTEISTLMKKITKQ